MKVRTPLKYHEEKMHEDWMDANLDYLTGLCDELEWETVVNTWYGATKERYGLDVMNVTTNLAWGLSEASQRSETWEIFNIDY